MAEPARSRRAALQALIASFLGAAGLWRFLTPRAGRATPQGSVSLPEADVPAGGALAMPEERLVIVRDGSGVHALDLTCTHLGCTVKVTLQGFACPCHGSRFDATGAVITGPAARPLARLEVDRRDGIIQVTRR